MILDMAGLTNCFKGIPEVNIFGYTRLTAPLSPTLVGGGLTATKPTRQTASMLAKICDSWCWCICSATATTNTATTDHSQDVGIVTSIDSLIAS
jgi:hypothetical protein